MADTSLADKLQIWKSLVDTMRQRLEELPHLQGEHAELEAVVKEIEALNSQEDVHTARLREITVNRQKAGRRGVEIRGRIQTGTQSRYGKRNPILHEFGFRPLAQPSPRKKEEGKEEDGQKPAAAAAAGS